MCLTKAQTRMFEKYFFSPAIISTVNYNAIAYLKNYKTYTLIHIT